jgi:hypothetical protein
MVTKHTDMIMLNKMFCPNFNFGIVIADVYFGAKVRIAKFTFT